MTSGSMIITCTDYGVGFTQSEVMQICGGTSTSTYSAGPCPSANRVGRCEITDSSGGMSVGESVSVYPPETAAGAKAICNMENGVNGVTTTFVLN